MSFYWTENFTMATLVGDGDYNSVSGTTFSSSAVTMTMGKTGSTPRGSFIMIDGWNFFASPQQINSQAPWPGVVSSFLKLYAAATLSVTTCTVRIWAWNDPTQQPNFQTPATAAAARATARSTAFVDWTIPAITSGTQYTSPDLAPLVREIWNVKANAPLNNTFGFSLEDQGSSTNALRSFTTSNNASPALWPVWQLNLEGAYDPALWNRQPRLVQTRQMM